MKKYHVVKYYKSFKNCTSVVFSSDSLDNCRTFARLMSSENDDEGYEFAVVGLVDII